MDGVGAFLALLSIDGGKNPRTLTSNEENRLVSALRERLIAQGTRPEFLEILTQERWTVPSLGRSTEELSNLQNATGRAGIPGVGIGVALGDARSIERAEIAEADWRRGILAGLLRIETQGVQKRSAIQWFDSPETPLAGTQAGLAINYLLDPGKPVFVFSREGEFFKVSARGTLWLVNQGLDLAETCRSAAHSVGGEGGGHKVAAGATIPARERDSFLTEANRRIHEQLPSFSPEVAA